MKIKDILEALGEEFKDDLYESLNNVGYAKLTLETDIPQKVVKKLEKKYGVPIKVSTKAKKAATVEKTAPVVAKTEEKIEKVKEIKEVEEKKIEPKKVDEKKVEVKKEEKPKEQIKKAEVKKAEAKKVEVEKPKQEKKPVEELELSRVYDDKYTDYEEEVKVYSRLRNIKRPKRKGGRQSNIGQDLADDSNVLMFSPGMTVAQIADGLGISVGEIVKKLIMLGFMVNASQVIDKDIVELLAEDAGFTLKDKVIEDITKFEDIIIEDKGEDLVSRSPIVTIMGHVDHGKTTLLDTIRDTEVTAGEAGGITQHIGAYQVTKNDKKITFIDTPGHAAFTEMRSRGAGVTDIVVLVVAADDGVMPQTKEAIDHAHSAKVPIIVAINKMDKPQADPDRVKQELSKYDLVPEEWGGSTVYVPISALKGTGISDLLEMIILTAEMLELKANPDRLGVGTVIEAKLDKGKGPVATLLIKNGTVKVGDPIVVGTFYGKIRAMSDELNKSLEQAGPAKAVEITGLSDVPLAGDHFMIFEDEKTAKLIAEERAQRLFDLEKGVGRPISLASMFDNVDDTVKDLNVIIKGDAHGSVEALKSSLEQIDVEGIQINVVRSSVGSVTETDVSLAIASKSIILGFNVRPRAQIIEYAREQNIEIRLYSIIYKVLEDIKAAMTGMLDPIFEEKVTGEAEVRNIFKASKFGTIAGCYVTNGVLTRNDLIRLIRDGIVIYEGKTSSLKRFKDDVKEVQKNFECGLTIENFNDIKENDIIEAYKMIEVKRV